MSNCHICHAPLDGDSYTLREQYFGTNEEFLYWQCPQCDCIQIAEIPGNLADYYPQRYYSKKVKKHYRNNVFLSRYRATRLNAALNNSFLANLLTKPKLPKWMPYIRLTSDSRILDAGCGSGQKLLNMRKKGFKHLHGVDPFIDHDIDYENGVVIHKCELPELAENPAWQKRLDLVMMHHSLEHIPDQHMTLQAAHRLLKNGGCLLIRIPLCSSFAWEHYRENWVQLDAPRHLYTHSRNSLELLAETNGFSISHIYYDSYELQFTGSERYLKGVSLVDGPDNEHFTAKQLQDFKNRAIKLNSEARGDQAVFILTKQAGKC